MTIAIILIQTVFIIIVVKIMVNGTIGSFRREVRELKPVLLSLQTQRIPLETVLPAKVQEELVEGVGRILHLATKMESVIQMNEERLTLSQDKVKDSLESINESGLRMVDSFTQSVSAIGHLQQQLDGLSDQLAIGDAEVIRRILKVYSYNFH